LVWKATEEKNLQGNYTGGPKESVLANEEGSGPEKHWQVLFSKRLATI
jgi:hypothetical protein